MRGSLLPALVSLLVAATGSASAQARPAQRELPREPAPTRERAMPQATSSATGEADAPITALSGTFLATRIDREALPLKDQVVDDQGTLYLIEFDRMVLSLRDDLKFRASVRYRRSLFSSDPRSRSRATPLQNMTVTGTYVIVNGEIRFTPDPSNETKGLRMLAGRIRSNRELEVPFHYRNGTRERDRTLVMTRRDDIL